ncbi:hypothetical protein F5B20DRAFT_597268 [Whalleya microplaca]|nr:hypothetical protein F5B20DRAFT_597268 [Whalleya microplaca]
MNKDITGSRSLPDDSQNPPDYSAYSDTASVSSSSQAKRVPRGQAPKVTKNVSTTATPYCPFPPVMKAYYQWNLSGIKVFFLCGPNGEQERLFAVEQHMGYSLGPPLGTRPGMILYNGTKTKDYILAACCDESYQAVRPYAFNPNSIILLPPWEFGSKFMVREIMRARTTEDNGVAFRFSLEVGHEEKKRRETFEWKKITKADKDEDAKQGGFKLLHVLPSPEQSQQRGGSSSQGLVNASSSSSAAAAAGSGDEVLAMFAWTKTLSNLKHPFTLEFVGSGRTGAWGERWTLAVIITAMRLWMLHWYAKTNRPVVHMSEKMNKA